MNLPEKTLHLEFTILEFHKNYVISMVKEDIILSKVHIQDLLEVCTEHFQGKKFVYISKRDNNYNVDPNIYRELEMVRKNLMGIAIVSERIASLNMAHFEKMFAQVSYEIFLTMEDAIDWAQNILK